MSVKSILLKLLPHFPKGQSVKNFQAVVCIKLFFTLDTVRTKLLHSTAINLKFGQMTNGNHIISGRCQQLCFKSCLNADQAMNRNSLWPSDTIWWHHGSDGTKPLPEPMLTDYQWSPVTFILGQFHEMPQPSVTKIRFKITYLKFHSNFPGVNELNWTSDWKIQNMWHIWYQYQCHAMSSCFSGGTILVSWAFPIANNTCQYCWWYRHFADSFFIIDNPLGPLLNKYILNHHWVEGMEST